MKHTLLYLTSFLILSITTNAQTFSDDFEGYNVGDYIGSNSTNWTTWSGNVGGAEDAQVVDDKANSGSKSIHLISTNATGGPQDVVLPFGGAHNTGTFDFESSFYVPNGKEAYFNFQANPTIGQVWAFDCFMNADGSMDFNSTVDGTLLKSTFPFDQWFDLKISADLNTNSWEVFVNNSSVGTFQNGVYQIASLDLFCTNDNSEFWVDDVSYNYTPYSNNPFNVSIAKIDHEGTGLAGQEKPLSVTIRNLGDTIIESVDVEIDINGTKINESFTGLGLPKGVSMDLNLTSKMTIQSGTNTITGTISNINGGSDDYSLDDSKVVILEPIIPAAGKIVIAEEGTGTWCQWCPRGAVMMEHMENNFGEYFQGIAIHNGDPMENTEYQDGFGPTVGGYPSAYVDRISEIDPSGIEGVFQERVAVAPKAMVEGGATYDDVTRELDVSITAKFNENVDAGWKMACVLVENNVSKDSSGYAQSNAYAGGANGTMGGYESLPSSVPASQMVYNDVARAISPSFNGYAFQNAYSSGDEISLAFSMRVSKRWNKDEIVIVGLLFGPNGQIENASSTTISEAVTNGFNSSSEWMTGITQLFDAPDYQTLIYPNPSNGNVIIHTSTKKGTINLYSLDGKQIFSERINAEGFMNLDNCNLNEGMYILETSNIDGKVMDRQKLIISK